jgi:hypothetical protein
MVHVHVLLLTHHHLAVYNNLRNKVKIKTRYIHIYIYSLKDFTQIFTVYDRYIRKTKSTKGCSTAAAAAAAADDGDNNKLCMNASISSLPY